MTCPAKTLTIAPLFQSCAVVGRPTRYKLRQPTHTKQYGLNHDHINAQSRSEKKIDTQPTIAAVSRSRRRLPVETSAYLPTTGLSTPKRSPSRACSKDSPEASGPKASPWSCGSTIRHWTIEAYLSLSWYIPRVRKQRRIFQAHTRTTPVSFFSR